MPTYYRGSRRMSSAEASSQAVVLMITSPSDAHFDRELITKKELAARLKKSLRCVEVWMHQGKLPFVRVGRSVLFHWPDVLKALERFEAR